MDDIDKMSLNEIIKKYPQISLILDKYKLKCNGCVLANNYTVEQWLLDKGKYKNKILDDMKLIINS